jgi:hypothetical protein
MAGNALFLPLGGQHSTLLLFLTIPTVHFMMLRYLGKKKYLRRQTNALIFLGALGPEDPPEGEYLPGAMSLALS